VSTPAGSAGRTLLRVLTVIDGLGPGGAEALLADLARAAAAAGLELAVVYLRDTGGSPAAARLRAAGQEPVLLPMSGPMGARVLPALIRHIRRLRPDVIHTHLGYADLLGALAGRAAGVPTVCTLHLAQWDAPTTGQQQLQLALFRAARRFGHDRVFAVSRAVREAYLAESGDAPDHVAVLHNGVTGHVAPGAGRRVRAELGLGPADTVVTMLSVLRPGKGHEAALAAVGRLHSTYPGLRLLICGDGPERDRLGALAGRLAVPVVFAGHRNDVMAVLDATDVLLHPSAHDAFPTALLEAQAARVPVVATAVGGIPEIVSGADGVLVQPPPERDRLVAALTPLLIDPAIRERLGWAGRARFDAMFNAAAWAGRLRTQYDQVLAARRTCGARPAGALPGQQRREG
jgi:glycosyltransferase involved in cell wall biosynthesis